jgi:hypothetical protein
VTYVRALRIAAGVEAVSLLALLVNVATVHTDVITSLGGPVHGTAYLAVIACTWLTPRHRHGPLARRRPGRRRPPGA